MGGLRSGNRNPRPRKSPENKSALFQFRLHPSDLEEVWLMERIDHYEKQGLPLRKLVLELMAAFEDRRLTPQRLAVVPQDVQHIRDSVNWLVEQVQSGNLGGGGNARKRVKDKLFEAPAHVREMLNPYMDGGISSDDDGDDYVEPRRYVKDDD